MLYRYLCYCFCYLILGINNNTYAQEPPKLIRQKLQLGLSSGAESSKHSAYTEANLSLHLISGFTAAIQGFQISTCSNRTLYYVNGMQLSLLSNVSGHSPYKVYNPKYDALKGVQISALLNKVEGSGKGSQLSLFNTVTGDFEGLQLGLTNSVKRGAAGVQIAGLLNLAPGRNNLFQLGLINYSKQAGHKFSGASFLLRDHIQIGLINKSNKNHGYQIGLINWCRSNEGIPIGLININPPDGMAVLAASELTNTYITIGTGSSYIINRLTLGYNYAWNQNIDWTFGYGIEGQFYKQRKIPVLSFYHDLLYLKKKDNKLFEQGLWVSKFGISYGFDIFDNFFPIMLGATFNIGYFSNAEEGLNLPFIISDNGKITIWPGLDLGFRF